MTEQGQRETVVVSVCARTFGVVIPLRAGNLAAGVRAARPDRVGQADARGAVVRTPQQAARAYGWPDKSPARLPGQARDRWADEPVIMPGEFPGLWMAGCSQQYDNATPRNVTRRADLTFRCDISPTW